MAAHEIPDDVSADYANTAVQTALHELQSAPDYERLAALLNALREGYLIADVTGTSAKRQRQRGKGPRVRTIRSTKGQLVLPLFTSMEGLRAAAGSTNPDDVRGVVMPAREALALIASDRFVAAELDKGSPDSLVMLRKYVTLAVTDESITAERLENMR
ncbi:SseB family protein [Leucobacter sp. GX24907]